MARYKIKTLTYRTLLLEEEFSPDGQRETLVDPLWLLQEQLWYRVPKKSIKTTLCYIKERNIDINRNIDEDGSAILHFAIQYHCDKKIIELLLEFGADKDKQDRYLSTPLYLTVESGDIEIIRLLIENGAGINIGNSWGATPFDYAVEKGMFSFQQSENYFEIMRLLIESGADINIQNYRKEAPLNLAFVYNDVGIMRLLIESGANMNILDLYKGTTVLHKAVESGNFEITRLLIEGGADMNIPYPYKKTTVLHKAVELGHVGITRLLIESGMDINIQDTSGETPLHWSVSPVNWSISPYIKRNVDAVRLLIDSGVDINRKNRHEQTPLDLAIDAGNKEIIQLLIEHGAKRGDELLMELPPVEE
jgi:ankyrin repeat protein